MHFIMKKSIWLRCLLIAFVILVTTAYFTNHLSKVTITLYLGALKVEVQFSTEKAKEEISEFGEGYYEAEEILPDEPILEEPFVEPPLSEDAQYYEETNIQSVD